MLGVAADKVVLWHLYVILLLMHIVRLLLQVLAKQAEWAAAGVDDHASSCKDFMQQLAYREYSRCGDC
jgi:hypothetical protein